MKTGELLQDLLFGIDLTNVLSFKKCVYMKKKTAAESVVQIKLYTTLNVYFGLVTSVIRF